MRREVPTTPEFVSVLEQQLPMLRAFVRLRMGPGLASRESCSDVIQSVCREFLAAKDRLEFGSDQALRAWIYTAALHKVMQKARHHRSSPRDVARETGVETELLGAYASCVTPSRDASAREQVERFERAFAQLPASHQEVVSLVRIAGLSHADTAVRLGTTVEGSRALLRRALVRLSALLADT